MTSRRAAFLDRDGVINHDSGYVHRIDDLVLIDGVVDALRLLASANYRLVIVTNQSGIGRGYYTEQDFQAFMGAMLNRLAVMGVSIDHVAHCPHAPSTNCRCRKPAPGMLLDAAALLEIDLARSVMIGDKPSDIEAGRNAGVTRCFLIDTPRGAAAKAVEADGVFPDLLHCARHIVAEDARNGRSATPHGRPHPEGDGANPA